MSEYQFTKDWFHWAPEVWAHLATVLPERRSFLEIGSFEGRSAVWIIENMMNPGDWIDCVDTWQGGEEHKNSGEDMMSVEARFDHNIGVALKGPVYDTRTRHVRIASAGNDAINNRVYKYKATSTEFLGQKLSHWVDGKDLYD